MNKLARTVNKVKKYPKWVLSFLIGRTVRFVGTSGIQFEEMTTDTVIATLNNNGKVRNHIGQIHAAAMILLAETATGMLVGMNIDDIKIPLIKSIKTNFVRRSSGAMRAVATITEEQKQLMKTQAKGEILVAIKVTDETLESPIECEMLWAWITKNRMNKQEIIQKLAEGFSLVDDTLRNIDDAIFYNRENNKWSIAENCKHLSLSVKPLNMAFSLPNFALLFFGKLNRETRSYEEMVEKYLQKLSEGAVATEKFIPEKLSIENKKEDLIEELKYINNSFLKKVNDFTEEDLDKYLLPHPVLGKLTIREMLYFTICHTLHHHKAILATT